MADSDFLSELHAQFEAPHDVIMDLIRRSTRRGIEELHRLTLGDENEIYRAGLSDGSVVYARIRRPGEGDFGPEVWAMEQARAAGLPVPIVLAVDEIGSETDPARSAMVIAESPGRQLADLLPTLSPEQRHVAMTNIGRALAKLHAIRTPGVRRPDLNGHWPDPLEAHLAFIAEGVGQRPHLVTAGLTSAEVAAIIEQIGKSPDTPATEDPVLCHGDLHSAHVFVDDDLEVCGIIDWGLWHGGSAIGELATMSMAYKPADFGAILTGHGTSLDDHPTLRRRLALSVINQAVGHVAWHESIGNADGTAYYVRALRNSLAELGTDGG